MSVQDHFRELRIRLTICLIALFAAGGLAFLFYNQLLGLLVSPLGESLYYNSPAGGFGFVMRVCTTAAIIVSCPIWAYNTIMFIKPAFEKRLSFQCIISATISATILAFAGAAFAFCLVLPATLAFLKEFPTHGLSALISADNYMGFVNNVIILFVLMFQIPLIMSFIDKVKPIQPKKLLKAEKWIVLGSVAAALVAPFTFDFLTSLMLAIPIIVLYNFEIAVIAVRHHRETKQRIQEKAKLAAKTRAKNIAIRQSAPKLSEVAFEGMLDDLIEYQKITPVTTTLPIKSNKKIVSDFKASNTNQPVQPAAWVEERKARRAAINNSASNIFSDVVRVQRT